MTANRKSKIKNEKWFSLVASRIWGSTSGASRNPPGDSRSFAQGEPPGPGVRIPGGFPKKGSLTLQVQQQPWFTREVFPRGASLSGFAK